MKHGPLQLDLAALLSPEDYENWRNLEKDSGSMDSNICIRHKLSFTLSEV